jgi:Neuraminidase (sialidase)
MSEKDWIMNKVEEQLEGNYNMIDGVINNIIEEGKEVSRLDEIKKLADREREIIQAQNQMRSDAESFKQKKEMGRESVER